MQEKKSKDPYEFINRRQQKIEVNPVVPYRSTSMDEVFEIRNTIEEANGIEEQNKFIRSKKPIYVHIDEEVVQKLKQCSRPTCDAY